MARIKQRQVLPCVDKQRSAAVKVKATDILTTNALIMATGHSGAHMTVELADADDFTEIGGTLWICDFAVAAGKTVSCAVPWKLITGIDTQSASATGHPVYLSNAGDGTWTLAPTAYKPHIRVGHVVTVGSGTTDGAILLNPGMPQGGGEAVMGDGGSAAATATVAVGAAYNGRPVVATMNGGTTYVTKAVVATGTLTITANNTSTDTVSYTFVS